MSNPRPVLGSDLSLRYAGACIRRSPMTYAAGITVSQLGELIFICCCCALNLSFPTAQWPVDVSTKQLLGGFGGRVGHVWED